MADNTILNLGSGGDTMATEDISGVKYQKVKIIAGNAASTTAIPGDATNGLDVDVTRLPAIPAGTNFIGEVRHVPTVTRISLTPTISTSVYASGDSLGGLLTFANAARISGGSGVIQSIVVVDKTQAQRAAIDLLFFDRSVTVAADNAAVAMSDADMANCLGLVSIGPYNTAFAGTPLNSVSTLPNVGLPFKLNGTDLYAAAIVRGTPTYTSTSDLIFILTILQD